MKLDAGDEKATVLAALTANQGRIGFTADLDPRDDDQTPKTGVRFEIETDDPAEVPEWEAKYLRAIERLTSYLDEATAELIR